MAFTQHPLTGETVSASDLARHLLHMGSQRARWIEGFTLTGTGLTLQLNDGFAFIGGHLFGTGDGGSENEDVPLTASATNHVYLKDDGTVEVNTTGTAPSSAHVKLFTVTTDGSGETGRSDLREDSKRVRYDAPLAADTLKAHSSGVNITGHRTLLEGTKPYTEYEDTDDSVRTRLWARSGKLQVVDMDGGTEDVLVDDLRAPATTINGDDLEWTGQTSGVTEQAERIAHKGQASGYASLDSGGQVPTSQTKQASESVRGTGLLANLDPNSLGTAAKGTSSRLAKADHVHPHGDLSGESGTKHKFSQISGTLTNDQHGSRGGGSLHNTATTTSHGFMSSSDKSKLNDATSAATASALMVRDSFGRAKVAAPSASTDIARKNEVDDVQSALDTHEADTAAHSATASATASRIIRRDSSGRAKVAAPSASTDIARKNEVDAVQTNVNSVDSDLQSHKGSTSAHSATASATGNRIVRRDSNGRASFTSPSSSPHAATKGYVDQREYWIGGIWLSSTVHPSKVTLLDSDDVLYVSPPFGFSVRDQKSTGTTDVEIENPFGETVTIEATAFYVATNSMNATTEIRIIKNGVDAGYNMPISAGSTGNHMRTSGSWSLGPNDKLAIKMDALTTTSGTLELSSMGFAIKVNKAA